MTLRARGRLAAIAPGVVSLLVVAALLVGYDTPAIDVLRYAAYLLVVVILPGAVVWGWFMARHDTANARASHTTVLERIVCGAAVGYMMEVAAYAVARAAGAPLLYLVVPAVVLLAAARSALRRRETLSPPLGRAAWAYVAVGGYAALWLLQTTLRHLPVGQPGTFTEPDEMFHLALIGELRHHFPAVYPYVESQRLDYQFFVHLHAAASSWATGIEPIELYRRFDPVVMTMLAVLGVGVITMRLTDRVWPGVLASGLLVFAGTFDVSGLARGEAAVEEGVLMGGVLVHSPTQTFAYVLVVPLLVVGLELVTPGRVLPWSTWLLFVLLSSGMSGAKVTYLPMLVVGFAFVAVGRSIRGQQDWRRAATAAVVLVAVLALATAVLYRGGSRGLAWGPAEIATSYATVFGGIDTNAKLTLVALCLLLCWLVPYVGALPLLRSRELRIDPRVWLLAATGAAGYGAAFLLVHPAHSERYFERSAALLLVVLGAAGLASLFPQGTQRGRMLAAGGLAIAAGAAMFVVRVVMESQASVERDPDGQLFRVPTIPVVVDLFVVMLGLLAVAAVAAMRRGSFPAGAVIVAVTGLGLARGMAFVTGQVGADSADPRLHVPEDGVEIALYLRDHSSPDDLVATNVHCGPVAPTADCDSRHFWMSAISERRFVIEGWAYVGASPTWTTPFSGDPALLTANDEAFDRPQALPSFVRAHEVRWLLVDRSHSADVQGLAQAGRGEVVMQGPGYALIGVDQP